MKRMKPLALLCLFLVLSIATLASAQGLYWESTTTMSGTTDAGKLSKSYAMPKMFRHEGENVTMIIRMDKETVYNLNPSDKTYWEMTFKEMEAWAAKMGSQMDASMAQMREQLKNMPEEQRKKVEEMMGAMGQKGTGKTKVDVVATGESRNISGFGCSKYSVKSDGKESMVLWVTKDVKGFDAIRKDYMDFSSKMMAISRMTAMGEAYKKIDGFPMETDMGQIKMVVTKVEKKSTPASDFEVPAGYTKKPPPDMGVMKK